MSLTHRSRLLWISTLAALVFLLFLLTQLDPDFLLGLFRRLEPGFLLLAVAGYALEGVFAALRLRSLHVPRPAIRYPDYLGVVAAHGFFILLLPARLGELPYLVMMRRRLGMPMGDTLANFTYQRVLDVIVLGLLFAIGVLGVLGPDSFGWRWVPVLGVLVSVLALLFIRLNRVIEALVPLLRGVTRRYTGLRRRLTATLLSARRWSLRLDHGGLRWWAMALTLCIWVSAMFGTWAAFRAYGFTPSTVEVLFLGAGLAFVSVIPLQTVAGFGINEVGLAGLLILTGMPWQEATAAAVAVRLTLVVVQLGGLVLDQLAAWMGARRR